MHLLRLVQDSCPASHLLAVTMVCPILARQVYVGNLVAGLVTEDALRQLFNSTMAAAFPGSMMPGLDAVVSVSLHSEGRYAFVELRTPEMATAALQLSNQVRLYEAAAKLPLSWSPPTLLCCDGAAPVLVLKAGDINYPKPSNIAKRMALSTICS